jgi:NAD(P)-dependent dehydrogenase (short-subunit alcohol dehydrogenase family)
VAVITGGSRGIGAATAMELARRGWDVYIGYRARLDAAERVAQQCRRFGRTATVGAVDVADEDNVGAFFETVDQTLGTMDVLVNSAGIVAPQARVEDIDGQRLARMFAVNVTGSFLCAREAVRRMSTRIGGMGGAIVNVSSAASRLGSPGEYVDYAASKAAIDTMTIGLAKEVADEGIRVNAVRPGLIETDIHGSGGRPDRPALLAPMIPMKRPGQATEVALAIAWLCSTEASYVTGALIDVSGGR